MRAWFLLYRATRVHKCIQTWNSPQRHGLNEDENKLFSNCKLKNRSSVQLKCRKVLTFSFDAKPGIKNLCSDYNSNNVILPLMFPLNLIIQLRRGLKLGQVSIYCHKLKLIHLYRFSPKKPTYNFLL